MARREKGTLGIAEIIGGKRAAILALAQKRGAYNVRVFGSVARGEARPDSDVEFLVEFRKGASIFDEVGLWLDLKELLAREVDLAGDATLKPLIKPHAMKDVQPL